ncbi:hypothetical protein FEM48_Zijuj11G0156200 [Ziziphus jujuba var. spinosa]|uniref:23 kDa jasmonate-induced protein-like n=1 Tax=Ziziphus jujuba var. spinosa TaxID=714518 RepID=A0A978UJT1_ZIZJJ|nr:hypothetical protein FEM48_Zijuj11G0156200 [Ziziphus jujuba var. spinosa]
MPKYQYNEVITAVDRAYEALIMKNADNKDVKARKFVESLKKNYGASLVATLCFIYNAAGNRLTFVVSHDWEGHIGDCPYPLLLENGQWGAFLHVQTSPYRGSVAATIYRGQDESGDAFDWMLSWQNVWNDNNGVIAQMKKRDTTRPAVGEAGGVIGSSLISSIPGCSASSSSRYGRKL